MFCAEPGSSNASAPSYSVLVASNSDRSHFTSRQRIAGPSSAFEYRKRFDVISERKQCEGL